MYRRGGRKTTNLRVSGRGGDGLRGDDHGGGSTVACSLAVSD